MFHGNTYSTTNPIENYTSDIVVLNMKPVALKEHLSWVHFGNHQGNYWLLQRLLVCK